MKKIYIIFSFVFCFILLSSCQNTIKDEDTLKEINSTIKQINEYYDEISLKNDEYSDDIFSYETALIKQKIYNSNSINDIKLLKDKYKSVIDSLNLTKEDIKNISENCALFYNFTDEQKEKYIPNGILVYYGKYNGFNVFNMKGRRKIYRVSYPNLYIADNDFRGSRYEFDLEKDGKFYTLSDAYNNKLVSKNDVDDIYNKYKSTNLFKKFDNYEENDYMTQNFIEKYNSDKIISIYDSKYLEKTDYIDLNTAIQITNSLINIEINMNIPADIKNNDDKLNNYYENKFNWLNLFDHYVLDENLIISFHDALDLSFYYSFLKEYINDAKEIINLNIVFPNLLKLELTNEEELEKRNIIDEINTYYDSKISLITKYDNSILSYTKNVALDSINCSNSLTKIKEINSSYRLNLNSLILTDEEINKINEIGINKYCSSLITDHKYSVDDLGMVYYYGKYNGYYVVNLKCRGLYYSATYPGNYDFYIGGINFYKAKFDFDLIKDDKCISLKEAYNKNLVTDEDLEDIYNKFNYINNN